MKTRVSTFLQQLGFRPFDVGDRLMAQTLEGPGLLLIGVAQNGTRTFDITYEIDLG